MSMANRVKKLEDRTGPTGADRVELVVIQGVRRDAKGELHTRPGFAMFPGHKGGRLAAINGETNAEFGTRARAHSEDLKQARKCRV